MKHVHKLARLACSLILLSVLSRVIYYSMKDN